MLSPLPCDPLLAAMPCLCLLRRFPNCKWPNRSSRYKDGVVCVAYGANENYSIDVIPRATEAARSLLQVSGPYSFIYQGHGNVENAEVHQNSFCKTGRTNAL